MPGTSAVDVGIVLALPIERDAILHQLSKHGGVHEEHRGVRTFYRAALPTKSGSCEVVVTMLINMGNVDAATATDSLIHHWSPSVILVTGIAASADPAVHHLGDVVVADSIYYYELEKIRARDSERRTRTILADPLLLDRAKNYRSNDWRGLIPTQAPESGFETRVRIGPIASGEKVVAYSEFVEELRGAIPKLAAIEMESGGAALAAQQAMSKPRFLAVRGISDYADDQKNDNWHGYAAHAAAAWTIGFLSEGTVEFEPRAANAVMEAKPKLALVAKWGEKSDRGEAGYDLFIENNGDRTAEQVVVEIDVPHGFGINKGVGGGWFKEPDFLKPRITVIEPIHIGDVGYVGRFRPFEPDPKKLSTEHHIAWRITARDTPRRDGEILVDLVAAAKSTPPPQSTRVKVPLDEPDGSTVSHLMRARRAREWNRRLEELNQSFIKTVGEYYQRFGDQCFTAKPEFAEGLFLLAQKEGITDVLRQVLERHLGQPVERFDALYAEVLNVTERKVIPPNHLKDIRLDYCAYFWYALNHAHQRVKEEAVPDLDTPERLLEFLQRAIAAKELAGLRPTQSSHSGRLSSKAKRVVEQDPGFRIEIPENIRSTSISQGHNERGIESYLAELPLAITTFRKGTVIKNVDVVFSADNKELGVVRPDKYKSQEGQHRQFPLRIGKDDHVYVLLQLWMPTALWEKIRAQSRACGITVVAVDHREYKATCSDTKEVT
jgi:nucleoside phosphorylase